MPTQDSNSSKKTALVDQDIQPRSRIREQLDSSFNLTVGVEAAEEPLADSLDGIDALFTTSRLPVTRDILTASELDLVAKIGTGIDNVDCVAAAELGISVIHTPGINALAVAEHTVSLMLAVIRQIVRFDRALERGKWRDDLGVTPQLSGKTVGIVGFGNVGRRVAALLDGFDVNVLTHDPYVQSEDTDLTGATLTPFEELVRRSDAVTVNAELTAETRGMFGATEFRRMKGSAILVNTARGPIIDQQALIEALEENEIAGAGLDVFETEPLPADSRLHDFPNVVATPHVAAATNESRRRCIDVLTETATDLLRGESVPERYIAVPPPSQHEDE